MSSAKIFRRLTGECQLRLPLRMTILCHLLKLLIRRIHTAAQLLLVVQLRLKILTGIKDSNWLLGYSISCQPHFKAQKPNELIVWLYGLFSDTKGNYVEKTMSDCNGIELCEEWLYHMGVPEERIPEMAAAATTIPAHMPYITSYFMPRALGDRPKVVPDH